MQVRNEWKQSVDGRQLIQVLASFVIFAVVLLSPIGNVIHVRQIFSVLVLVAVWAVAFAHFLRYGKRAFPLARIVSLLGVTLFFGATLIPVHADTAAWIENFGTILLLTWVLMSIFTFRKVQSDGHLNP